MAKSAGSLVVFLSIFILLLFCNLGNLFLGCTFNVLFHVGQQIWNVAKPSTSDVELNEIIEYSCSSLGDCKMIQQGGSCFNPNTLINFASVVMNQYYATNGSNI
ncbi:hypothetical protein AAZX31_08G080500 [Glycine max]